MTTYTPPPPATAPAAAPPPQKSSGCLKFAMIGCGIVLVLAAILAVVIVAVVFGAVKSTDVYKGAVRKVQQDPRVVAALGEPVKPGFIVTGSVSVKNQNGTANMNFPVHGPKDKADVHVEATLDAEGWHYSTLTVIPNRGQPIDLLNP